MRKARTIFRFLALVVVGVWGAANAPAKGQQAESAVAKALGTVKTIADHTLTLTTAKGEVSVTVANGARLLRIPPGQTDLKQAAPLALKDLQPGDRILVRGTWGPDGKTLEASSVIAMKQQDIAERQAQERAEWQHGVGGLVSAVDQATGTVTVTVPTLGVKRSLVVHISKSTVLRRYAPDSVKFADAKPSSFNEIKVGDQLRARGTRSPDGNELSAEEVVSGSFHNIAGVIAGIDAAAETISVNDLETKRPMVVKVTAESQLRRLPPQLAQHIAMRLKGGEGAPENAPDRERIAPGTRGSAPPNGSQGERPGGASAADLQQVISRLPAITLTELQKTDAVMIVSTEGTPSSGMTAITLLTGVEPILQASPKGQSILTPWSLNTSGDTGEQQ